MSFRIKSREIRGDHVVVGTSSQCDVRLDDPIAAAKHCRLTLDSGRLVVQDLGSTTGTYVDGVRVPGSGTEIAGSAELVELVIGASKILIGRDGDVVTLQPKERSFQFVEPKRGENVADRSEWSFSELGLGRMRSMLVANRAAIVLVVALGGLLWLRPFREPLLSPGCLSREHARLFAGDVALAGAALEIASSQGCGACHVPGGGTPVSKCAQCHGDLVANCHPFADAHARGRLAGVSSSFDADECNACHVEHSPRNEAGWSLIDDGLAETTRAGCLECHAASSKVGGRIEAARAALASGSAPSPIEVQRTAPPVPLDGRRAITAIAFAHADHVANDVDGDGAADVDLACGVCHVPTSPPAGDDEFARVPYETCARCHVRGRRDPAGLEPEWARWTSLAEFRGEGDGLRFEWDLRWHGSDDPSRCLQCHASLDDRATWHDGSGREASDPADPHERIALAARRAGLKTVSRRVLPPGSYDASLLGYDVQRRTHAEHFRSPADCTKCHLDAKPDEEGATVTRPFLHALHLSHDPVVASDADRRALLEECSKCHFDRASSKEIADVATQGPFKWDEPVACQRCHKDDAGNPLPIVATESNRAGAAGERRLRLPDFPHSPHLPRDGAAPPESLEQGCFACHRFVPASDAIDAHAVVETTLEARDCRPCHTDHGHVAGGACQKCHPQPGDQNHSFWGADPPPDLKPLERPWPSTSRFDHSSRGHAAFAKPGSAEQDCRRCHDVVERASGGVASIASAKTLESVPIPTEAQQVCRECHVNLGTLRFHWR